MLLSKCGVRQGFIISLFLFLIGINQVYKKIEYPPYKPKHLRIIVVEVARRMCNNFPDFDSKNMKKSLQLIEKQAFKFSFQNRNLFI